MDHRLERRPRLPVLGWKEEASLPDWGIRRLRVKLDTGAKTSAIHVSSYEQVGEHVHEGDTLPVARLVIPLSRIRLDRVIEVETPVYGFKSVRDTGAKAETRPVVRVRLVCGPIDRVIDVTVTDRSGMIFRMILGRQALEGQVVVDPSRGYTMLARPRRKASPRPTHDVVAGRGGRGEKEHP